MNRILQAAALAALATGAGSAFAFEPLTIADQGSFAVGGTVIETPGAYYNNAPTAEGQSFHGDHAYAFYQIPPDARPLPLVLWHGAYQSGRRWETTPDGREGFQMLFLRRGFPVYVIDQPCRGRDGCRRPASSRSPPRPACSASSSNPGRAAGSSAVGRGKATG